VNRGKAGRSALLEGGRQRKLRGMFDHDVVIIGGGPAGLAAGLHLSRAGHRTLLLERELFGGNLKNVDLVEDYPHAPGGVAGAQLASEMAERARASGLQLREAEVTGIEAFSSTRWVGCADGGGHSAAVVIVAAGSRFKKLGVPGEELLLGRGVIDCTPCDGALFVDRTVVVCGSDDHALADALYLAKLGVRVTLLTRSADLRAGRALQQRALAHPRIEIRSRANLESIEGTDRVEGVTLTDTATGLRETIEVGGVVIRVGSEPNTRFLEDVLDLDPDGRVVTGATLETSAPGVLAAGDVRGGSRPRVAAAVEDGTAAAMRAEELLAVST
jgi:thioredoxin reductase (NADPH)